MGPKHTSSMLLDVPFRDHDLCCLFSKFTMLVVCKSNQVNSSFLSTGASVDQSGPTCWTRQAKYIPILCAAFNSKYRSPSATCFIRPLSTRPNITLILLLANSILQYSSVTVCLSRCPLKVVTRGSTTPLDSELLIQPSSLDLIFNVAYFFR